MVHSISIVAVSVLVDMVMVGLVWIDMVVAGLILVDIVRVALGQ